MSIAIGDVSGKGVPAAILMTLIRAVLKTLSFYGNLPDVMLTRLNEIVYEDVNEEMFLTLFYSTYDFEKRTFYFSNAGHNPIIYYSAKEDKLIEEKTGIPVMIAQDAVSCVAIGTGKSLEHIEMLNSGNATKIRNF